ncbi:MAG TPA: glycosyltransferase [Candidatus Limnocylindria bacterium]
MRASDAGPLRVAIFGESYLPYLSGVTVSTEALARGLGRAGHRVLLVAPRPATRGEPGSAGSPGPSPEYAWLPSYQPPRPAPPGYRMPLPLPSAALHAATDFAPDVVHAQSPFVSGLMARRTAQRVRAPLVFTHHTRFADYGHYLGPLAGAGRTALNAYMRDFWTGCAAIVAPGTQLADEVHERLAGRRRPLVRVIPTGLDVASLAALRAVDPRPAHGWPSNAVVVVSVGRLALEKSVDLLLDAFARAAAGDERLRLLLVGRGPAEPAVRERAAAPDLAGRVGLTGQRQRLDALAVARGADLFAFASRTETQGLVLAEALAVGLPVVALDGPGVRDSVRDGVDGVVVAADPAPTRAERLGLALASLAEDVDRRRALATAAARDATRFDVARRVDETVALYRELLA